jgi:hypothetical protein
MAQPITWQNVNGVSLSDAGRSIDSAQRSFNGAFDGLQGVIKDHEAIDTSNMAVQKQNNTQSYLDKVAELGRTPAQLQAAIQTGQLEQLRASFGPNIDHAATRGAAESLLDQRYKQVAAANEFADKTLTREQRPIHDSILTKAYAGDTKGAMDLLAQNPGLMGSPEIQRQVGEYANVLKLRGQEDTRFTREGDLFKVKLANEKNQVNVQNANIAQSNAAVRASDANVQALKDAEVERKDIRDATKRANVVQSTKLALKEAGNLYSDGVYNGSQAPDLIKEMVASGVGDDASERLAILKRFEKGTMKIKSPDGKSEVDVPIPLSAMRAAILGSKDQIVNWRNQGWANEAEANLKSILQSTYTTQGANGQQVLANKAADDYSAFTQTLKNAIQDPLIKGGNGNRGTVPPPTMPKRR